MGLETGTQIGDLVPANPPGTDPKAQGDDHLRLIKTCVQGSLGLMNDFWTIPTVGPGLQQRNVGDTANLNLINLVDDSSIDIGETGIDVSMYGDLGLTGVLDAIGGVISRAALTVTVGGAFITGGLSVDGASIIQNGGLSIDNGLAVLAGGAGITGLLTVDGATNLGGVGGDLVTLSSGSNILMAGGFLDLTTLDSELGYSIKLARTGVASGNMVQMTNDGAAGTYRPIAFLVHDDAGAIRLGSANTDNTFVILEETIRLGNLPDGPSGLTQGDLYHTFGNVQVVL